MEEPIMTTAEVNIWHMIGADMGLEFDELGHPYQPGPARDIDGAEYAGAYDWRPLESDADCLGVAAYYDIGVYWFPDAVSASTPISYEAIPFHEMSGDKRAALRRAVFLCAAQIVRAKLRAIDALIEAQR